VGWGDLEGAHVAEQLIALQPHMHIIHLARAYAPNRDQVVHNVAEAHAIHARVKRAPPSGHMGWSGRGRV
jgi:hypothetical protein